MSVLVRRLTPEDFAPFGKVVRAPSGEPSAQGPAYKFWSAVAAYRIEGETEIGICTAFAEAAREVSAVERHLHTPEILIPIDAPFVLPVLREGEDEAAMQAFLVDSGEGVVIDPGVWHAACVPVGEEVSSYFVIFRRNTPREDVMRKEIRRVHIPRVELQ